MSQSAALHAAAAASSASAQANGSPCHNGEAATDSVDIGELGIEQTG
ncbi:MAG: hypothetical protein ACKODG_10140 [Betaproteobacteria bacterium]